MVEIASPIDAKLPVGPMDITPESVSSERSSSDSTRKNRWRATARRVGKKRRPRKRRASRRARRSRLAKRHEWRRLARRRRVVMTMKYSIAQRAALPKFTDALAPKASPLLLTKSQNYTVSRLNCGLSHQISYTESD